MRKTNNIKKFLNKIKFRPYVIAEVGVNHEGSIKIAKKMILMAKKGGADGVKFQTYKAELLASKNSPAYWDTNKEKTKNQFELFKKYDKFNANDYRKLYQFCKKKILTFYQLHLMRKQLISWIQWSPILKLHLLTLQTIHY